MSSTTFLRNGDSTSSHVLLLAHGAGAGMDTDFMNAIAQGIAEHSIAVLRFEFPYMQRIRELGKKRPPDSAPKLLAHFLAMIDQLKDPQQRLWIGGKSMGSRGQGRHHSAGCICLGYLFIHLADPAATVDLLPTCPTLIIQGMDPFGKPEEDPP